MPKSVDFLVLRYGYVYADHGLRLWYRWKLFCALLFSMFVSYFLVFPSSLDAKIVIRKLLVGLNKGFFKK